MTNVDALVFLDANQYLYLYEATKGKKLLDSLMEQQDYIFVTMQVVEEVQRNKLRVTAKLLSKPFELLEVRGFSEETGGKLHTKLKNINQRIKKINAEVEQAAHQTLQRISRSEDKVSKALAALFSKAVIPTPEEIRRARDRKERGNPPGKEADPLGDQLTWEQLLSHYKGKSKIWIISRDRDYSTLHDGKIFLNPFLHEDLARLNQPPPEVFCFDNLGEGLTHFVKTTRVKAKKLLTPEESKEIKEELDSLPPLGWLSAASGMDDAYWVANLSARNKQISAPLWAAMSIQGYPPVLKTDPDKP